MEFKSFLSTASQVILRQHRELVELFGVERRNTYDVVTDQNVIAGTAVEQPRGWFGVILRQVLKHWRTFTVKIFDDASQEILTLHHPFRFYFQRLEITGADGKEIGHMQRHFAIFSKKFVIHVAETKTEIAMKAGFFKIWTFPFTKQNREVAVVKKQWGGALKEMFLDADTFLIEITDPTLTYSERQLILSAAVFIDLNYFEENQKFSIGDVLNS